MPYRDYAALGERLRALREERGLSRRLLVAQVGLSRSYLTNLELGSARPSRTLLERLAAALDADAQELLRLARYEG